MINPQNKTKLINQKQKGTKKDSKKHKKILMAIKLFNSNNNNSKLGQMIPNRSNRLQLKINNFHKFNNHNNNKQ